MSERESTIHVPLRQGCSSSQPVVTIGLVSEVGPFSPVGPTVMSLTLHPQLSSESEAKPSSRRILRTNVHGSISHTAGLSRGRQGDSASGRPTLEERSGSRHSHPILGGFLVFYSSTSEPVNVRSIEPCATLRLFELYRLQCRTWGVRNGSPNKYKIHTEKTRLSNLKTSICERPNVAQGMITPRDTTVILLYCRPERFIM